MILYHGTNVDFDKIDINFSNPFKDFGQGFYLTPEKEHALKMAYKKVRIYGGEQIVQRYEFDLSNELIFEMNVLKFNFPDISWAEFVYRNRNRREQYKHGYDIVIGPIADDGVAYLLGRYDEGTLRIEELAKELEYKELSNQYFFGTERSLKLLKRI